MVGEGYTFNYFYSSQRYLVGHCMDMNKIAFGLIENGYFYVFTELTLFFFFPSNIASIIQTKNSKSL